MPTAQVTKEIRSDTAASKEMQGVNHVAGERLVVDGVTGPLKPYDMFTITPEDREKFNIGPNDHCSFIRDPADWKSIETTDRAREWLYLNPGGYIPKDEHGNYCKVGDLIVAVRPAAMQEEVNRRLEDEGDAFMDRASKGLMETDEEFNPKDEDFLRRQKEMSEMVAMQEGWVGPSSPTSGVPYNTAKGMRSPEEIEREETRYRTGGRHVNREPDFDGRPDRGYGSQAAYEEGRDRLKASQTGRKSFTVPDWKNKNKPAARA